MEARERYRAPSTRPLRVFAFDPSAGRRLNNYMTLPVEYEKLEPGPVGAKLAVIDYDASSETFLEPVDLDNPSVLICSGLEPSESDPRFHQQMVYAIASETVRRFEFALGRQVSWTRDTSRRDDPFHAKLRIFPHAFRGRNAFYDQGLRAVLFGYFTAGTDDAAEVLPGQTVFTCLSHDIIVHEMTHAILDGQRDNLTQATGPDAAAFHEAFADIVALFQHFTYADALLDTINRTGGLIFKRQIESELPKGDRPSIIAEMSEDNPLVGLAREFGHATGKRGALRSAIGTPPNSKDIETVTEAHLRGAILVSAVFDAFFTVYIKRTRDLMRIARAGGASNPAGDLHPDLAKLLAQEVTKIAGRFVNICIRAVDYLPPLDVQFGEFLRALITADSDLVPDDPHGYRAELIKAFRLRGIIPQGVTSYAEEALRWSVPEFVSGQPASCTGLDYDTPKGWDEAEQLKNRERRARNAVRLVEYAKANRKALGLDPDLPVQAHSYHPIHRISPSGRMVVDFVAELLQQREEPINPDLPGSPTFKFKGGSTVVFDDRGEARYVVTKRIANQSRLAQQRSLHLQQLTQSAGATYRPDEVAERVNFKLVHSTA